MPRQQTDKRRQKWRVSYTAVQQLIETTRDRDMSVCYSFDEAIVRNDYMILDEWRGVRGSELLLF